LPDGSPDFRTLDDDLGPAEVSPIAAENITPAIDAGAVMLQELGLARRRRVRARRMMWFSLFCALAGIGMTVWRHEWLLMAVCLWCAFTAVWALRRLRT